MLCIYDNNLAFIPRLLEYTIGNMVEKVLEFFGFNKLEMKFVLTELLSSCLILLGSQSLMKVSRYFFC